jgi:hypothetical protein
MQKKLLLLLVLGFWPSFCYSEEPKSIVPYYGYTGNAVADQALRWSMGDILPKNVPGVFLDNIIYSYKIDKNIDDTVAVTIYNENAAGNGYVFRETDEWLPGSIAGTQIDKVLPLGRLHREIFGEGGIEVVGPGSVYDGNVVYTYKVEPCYDPQYDPNCPDYKIPVPVMPEIDYEIYDAVAEGDSSQEEWNPSEDDYSDEETLTEEELAEQEAEEDKDREERLEEAFFEAGRAALFAQALTASMLKDAQNIDLNTYTSKAIPGGTYKETVTLVSPNMADNKSGLRNGFAQQLLHQQMVEMQYNKNN